MINPNQLTRRSALLAGVCSAVAACSRSVTPSAMAGNRSFVPLPDAEAIRRDYQTMVDFGPRLPGTQNHIDFVDYMAREFEAAGLTLGPCETYTYRRWEPKSWGLRVLDGMYGGPVVRPAYYVRSAPTPPEGVEGPLVYGGKLEPGGPVDLPDIPEGSIVVFDAELPKLKITQVINPHFAYVEGETEEDLLDGPYKRLWTMDPFQMEAVLEAGAAGAAIILDVPAAMLSGNFSPHAAHYKNPLPTLFVAQDVGDKLRQAARSGDQAHFLLDADWIEGEVPQLTAILPGASEEVMIINSHSDGQNFIEENGCMALIELAKHFASLPQGERLKRTLVFAAWPGHMSGSMPEAPGWVLAHQDLADRAAAAFSLEHLGATEWLELPDGSYGPTGKAEPTNLPVSAGPLDALTINAIKEYGLLRHVVEKGPGFSPSRVFHDIGVPHVGLIAGPTYLLCITENGEMDKLDADLAARQTAMMASLIKKADKLPMSELKQGDMSLGAAPIMGADESTPATCKT